MPKDQAVTSEKPKRGRPWKNRPETLERALAAAREGLPLRFCAGLAGVSYQSLNEYRKADPDFDQRLETAMSEGVQTKFRAILKAGYGNDGVPPKWEALAWALERAHCNEFSRPEIQMAALSLQVNQTNNTIVITAEQAASLQKRNSAINDQLAEIEKVYNSRRGSADGATEIIREVESQSSLVASGPISLPGVVLRTSSWWKMLSTGDAGAQITLEAAQYIVQTVATDALGAQRAESVKIDLDESTLALRDVWEAVQSFGGWEALVKRGEVERGSKHP